MIRVTTSLAWCALFIMSVATHAAHADTQGPEQVFVYSVAEEVLETIRTTDDNAEAQAKLEAVFTNTVDIDWVGQFVLGRHWRQASDEQKALFLQNYRAFMVQSYTKRLRDYSGENYDVSKPEDLGRGRQSLTMRVYRDSGKPVLIDYRIRKNDGEFKVYDLVVEGISLITTQRSEFDSVVNRKGLDFLITILGKKAAV